MRRIARSRDKAGKKWTGFLFLKEGWSFFVALSFVCFLSPAAAIVYAVPLCGECLFRRCLSIRSQVVTAVVVVEISLSFAVFRLPLFRCPRRLTRYLFLIPFSPPSLLAPVLGFSTLNQSSRHQIIVAFRLVPLLSFSPLLASKCLTTTT